MFCHICQKEIDYGKEVFSRLHLNKFHNISSKEYYDKFLSKDGDGVCPVCGQETVFLGIGVTKGYRKYCSAKCSNSDESKKKKIKSVLKSKY